jgi:3-methyladenine DNA glycosylase/8-oxoguanine DNA glycosylase
MTLPSEPRERLLLALRRADPDAFRREVRAVLAAQLSTSAAARALGLAEATLRAAIADDPGLARGLDLDD